MEEHHAIRVRHAARSPLGGISVAGFIHHSRGLPAHPLRRLGSYALVYVLDGGGRYRDATGLSRAVRAGDLLLLFPDLPHTYGPEPTTHWTEFYLVFDGPVFDLWRQRGLLDPAAPLRHLEPIERWSRRFAGVLDPPDGAGRDAALLEVCRLQDALAEALGHGGDGAEADDAWVARARALLESDLGRELDLAAVAADLGMSYDGFRKRFARAVGVPPARYRGIRAIDRACELMQEGGLTDRQIAERLGFCDEFYFSRRFKHVTGRSPSRFRADLPRVRA